MAVAEKGSATSDAATIKVTVSGIPQTLPLPALTGNKARDVANIAISQKGYDGSNGSAYGVWWNSVTDWGVDYTYSDWCGMFAAWCAFNAGSGLGTAYDKNAAGAGYLLDWCHNNASYNADFTATPQAGDYIFFSDYKSAYTSTGSRNSIAHVAIVTDYNSSSKTITFYGGNQNSSVTKGTVTWASGSKWGSQYVVAIGRPDY